MKTRWRPTDEFLIFIMTVSVCLLFAGGRVASSDENAFFLETRSLVEEGTLAIPEGIVDNGAYGADGRFYVGAGIGYTILSIPFYLVGKGLVWMINPPGNMQILILKSFFSLTNQLLAGFLAVAIFGLARRFEYSRKIAFSLVIAILFTTNIFPYTKSAMREIAVMLCLVGCFSSLYAHKMSRRYRDVHVAGAWLAWLLTLKISFAIVVPCYFFYAIISHHDAMDGRSLFSTIKEGLRIEKNALWILLVWTALGFGVVLMYQGIIFGNPFASGYSQRNTISFSTPLWVGLYGLLLSSGKSFFLYAPITILFFAAANKFRIRFSAEFLLILSIALIMTVFHAKFFSWASDGSWGPRYLLPVIPLIVMPVGILLYRSNFRRWFWTLALLGGVIQVGGSAVYFGSYLRYLGEFPFTRSVTDPEFMYKSHFVPNFSPAIGHWLLLTEAIDQHREGRMSGFIVSAAGSERLPLAEADRGRLVYIIDVWFMYAYYAGLRPIWCALAALGFGLIVLTLLVAAIPRFLRE